MRAPATEAPLVFVDSNVFIYCEDGRDPAKQDQAIAWVRHLFEHENGRVSIQVLNEFYTNTLRLGSVNGDKLAAQGQARQRVRELMAWNPAPVESENIEMAWQLQGLFNLSYWDALIVATALQQGCTHLLSEDLQAGLLMGGLLVVNPFLTPPSAI